MSSTGSSGRLSGRCAVVTGGARGIGLSLAESFAREGADVALLDLLDDVEQVATDLAERTGRRAVGVSVDVTDTDSVTSALDRAEHELGPADILLNSAGITSGTSAIDLDADEWRRVFDVNVTGTFLMSQAFARRIADRRHQGPCSILNMSSMSAFAVNVPQTQAAYNASKAAVSMLTSSLAIEWLPLGIRVNALAPGYVASDMTRDFARQHPEVAGEWIARTPAGRMAEPADLVGLALFLVAPGSEYVVGQSIVIDGGYTLI